MICTGDAKDNSLVVPLPNSGFVKVSGSAGFCALKNDTSIVCWGYSFGSPPEPNYGYIDVTVGYNHACALKNDTSVVCWGIPDALTPPEPNTGFKKLALSRYGSNNNYCCALKLDTTVVCWGSLGSHANPSEGWIDITAGNGNVIVIRPLGWQQWGKAISTFPFVENAIQVVAGEYDACFLNKTGSIFCFSYEYAVPQPNTQYIKISHGRIYACALRIDGSATCWTASSGTGVLNYVPCEDDNCLECPSFSNECTSCESGYELVGYTCVLKCFNVSAIDSKVCSGHGSCIDINMCNCHENFSGSDCSVPICFGTNATMDEVCSSYGSCVAANTCDCYNGYTSYECNVTVCFNMTVDDASVCSGHGSCESPDQCMCEYGWTNVNCSSFTCFGIDNDASDVCSGNGECANIDDCICDDWYIGYSCHQIISCNNISISNDSVCSGNGNCTATGCICNDGYFGEDCIPYEATVSSIPSPQTVSSDNMQSYERYPSTSVSESTVVGYSGNTDSSIHMDSTVAVSSAEKFDSPVVSSTQYDSSTNMAETTTKEQSNHIGSSSPLHSAIVSQAPIQRGRLGLQWLYLLCLFVCISMAIL
jgi:hypothetical protein